MVLLSITGLFKTLLIIIGVMVLLRLIGRVMVAKRNMDEHNRINREKARSEEIVNKAKQNFGKTTISKIGKGRQTNGDFVDFEEITEE